MKAVYISVVGFFLTPHLVVRLSSGVSHVLIGQCADQCSFSMQRAFLGMTLWQSSRMWDCHARLKTPCSCSCGSGTVWRWHTTSWIVLICLVSLMMLLMMRQPHLHQPWRLNRCTSFIHSAMMHREGRLLGYNMPLQYLDMAKHGSCRHIAVYATRNVLTILIRLFLLGMQV